MSGLDHARIVAATIAELKAKGFLLDAAPKLGNTGKSGVEVFVDALALNTVEEIENHYTGTSGTGTDSILNSLVGDGVPKRVGTAWAMVNDLLTQSAADLRYATPLSVTAAVATRQAASNDLSAIADASGTGYLKKVASGVWNMVSSIPWADLTGVPGVTAGTGLTGGGVLTAGVTLAVAFAGTGAAATASRSDHTHSGYAASSHTHTASQISDSTTTGRSVLLAADQASARTALGLTAWATKAYTNGSTTDVAEGSNLYYTDARARAAITATTPIIATAGVISHSAADGNLHVPATGTTNNGKWLKAGATAGAISWQALTAGDLPGAASTFAGLANGDGCLRNTGSGVLSWTPVFPIKSYSSTGLGNFGGSGQASAPALLSATDNMGIGLADGRSLSWRAALVSSDSLWGLWQDAYLSSSLKDFVIGDGTGAIWYRNSPLGSSFKHFFTGNTQFSAGLVVVGQTTLATSLTGMLKATAGVVSAASASDLPSHTHTASQISDSTVTGRSVLLAADQASARTAIGLTGWATKAYTNGSTTDVAEGSNFYYTDARARAAITATTPIIATAGVISHSTADGNLHVPATSTTNNGKWLKAGATAGAFSWQSFVSTDLPSHASLHHWNGSDPLAGQSIAGLLTTSTPQFAGLQVGALTGIIKGSGGYLQVATGNDLPTHIHSVNDLGDSGSVGRNLLQCVTQAGAISVLGLTGWTTKTFTNGSTTDVAEGSNLYYTDARARAAITAASPIIATAGVISHSAADGNLHVPATGTTSNGKWLKAGATAGSFSWQSFVSTDLPFHASLHHWNGADPLAGQSIAGLLVTSIPQFAGLSLTGNILVNQDTLFAANSVDGNEQSSISVCGGGSSSSGRGSFVQVRGNERPSSGGTLTLSAGDGIQGNIEFSTGGALRATLTKAGEFNISSGALRVGSISSLLAATGGLIRAASASDLPGASGTLAALANGDGCLRNTGAGVLSWTPVFPIKSYSSTGLGNFGGLGQVSAPAFLAASDNMGIGLADSRGLNWRAALVSSNSLWGLWQDATLPNSLKDFVLGDGTGAIWYRNSPLASAYKHDFYGKSRVNDDLSVTGDFKQGSVTVIGQGQTGYFNSIQLSNVTNGQMPTSNSAGAILPSGQSDDGTYFTSYRLLRLWNALTKSGNTWNSIQWNQNSEERASIFSSDSAGAGGYHSVVLVPFDPDVSGRVLGGIDWAQRVSGKTGTNPGLKVCVSGLTSGYGGLVGGFGGQLRIEYRPDNGSDLVDALRIGALANSFSGQDAVEARIHLRANSGFSATGAITLAPTVGRAFISDAALYQTLTFDFVNVVANGQSNGMYWVRRCSTSGLTETLPEATGSGRVLIYRYCGASGSWTIQASGSDVIDNNTPGGTVASFVIAYNSFTKTVWLLDAAPGRWDRIN